MLPALSRPFYSNGTRRELGPGPSDISFPRGGLLAQPPRQSANSSGNYSASHGEEENIPVLGTGSGSAIPAKSSPMIWTRLQRFCTDGCCRVW